MTENDDRELPVGGPDSEEQANHLESIDFTEESIPFRSLADDLHDTDLHSDEIDSMFEEMNIESIDADAVWEELESAETSDDKDSPGDECRRTISKRRYCHRCEYFSDPPTISCSHPGTTILSFPDTEHVEVENCPKVRSEESMDGTGEIGTVLDGSNPP